MIAERMTHFFQITPKELESWLAERNHAAYRKTQIFDWVYRQGVLQWEKMTNLGQGLKKQLSLQFTLSALELVRKTESQDGETTKFLWRLSDGALVESVLIRSDKRRTVCVSSQVGCPARCAFCASGQKGFIRHLSASEIVAQVMMIHYELTKVKEAVTHVVYMGMGEPLENYGAVIQSIKQLCSDELFGLSQRRVTVSTVGIVDGIRKMVEEDLKVSLVLSLHAPNQHVRKKIIPYARKYSLDDILCAIEMYAEKTKRNTTYEYILIKDINDQDHHAEELSKLLQNKPCTVNLIPYNPVPGVRLKRPATKTIHRFMHLLQKGNITVTCRFTKGDDIAAACGQLALQEESELNQKAS